MFSLLNSTLLQILFNLGYSCMSQTYTYLASIYIFQFVMRVVCTSGCFYLKCLCFVQMFRINLSLWIALLPKLCLRGTRGEQDPGCEWMSIDIEVRSGLGHLITYRGGVNKFIIAQPIFHSINEQQRCKYIILKKSSDIQYIALIKQQMATETLPKLMFLNEQCEQLLDARLKRKQIITENQKKQVIQYYQYKFKSVLPLPHGYQLCQGKENVDRDTTIFNSVYSNSLGKLIFNCQKGIAAYGLKQLEPIIKQGKITKPKIISNKKGSIFLSPQQTKMLLINQKQIILYTLGKKFAIQSTTPNTQGITNACWQNEDDAYLWSFQKQLYSFTGANGVVNKLQGVEKCTGVNRLGKKRMIVMEGISIHIYEQKTRVKTIDISQKNNQTAFFEFMCFIAVEKLNNRQKEDLTADDNYLIIGVYYTAYDEDDQQPCHRYAFFMNGHLFDEDNIKVRANELIMSINDDEKYYLAGENKNIHIGFSCHIQAFQTFLVVLVQKLSFVFFVSSTEKFNDLFIYTTWPNHNFKIPTEIENKFLRGMAVMRNMLPFQRQEGANDTMSKIICNKQIKGQFLRLFFKSKETQLTIQFPPSVFTFSDEFMFRKYAACTINASEQQKEEEIKKYVQKVGKSRYIMEPKPKERKMEEGGSSDQEESDWQQLQEAEIKVKKQQIKKPQEPKQQKEQIVQKKEQKKQNREQKVQVIVEKIEQKPKQREKPKQQQEKPKEQQKEKVVKPEQKKVQSAQSSFLSNTTLKQQPKPATVVQKPQTKQLSKSNAFPLTVDNKTQTKLNTSLNIFGGQKNAFAGANMFNIGQKTDTQNNKTTNNFQLSGSSSQNTSFGMASNPLKKSETNINDVIKGNDQVNNTKSNPPPITENTSPKKQTTQIKKSGEKVIEANGQSLIPPPTIFNSGMFKNMKLTETNQEVKKQSNAFGANQAQTNKPFSFGIGSIANKQKSISPQPTGPKTALNLGANIGSGNKDKQDIKDPKEQLLKKKDIFSGQPKPKPAALSSNQQFKFNTKDDSLNKSKQQKQKQSVPFGSGFSSGFGNAPSTVGTNKNSFSLTNSNFQSKKESLPQFGSTKEVKGQPPKISLSFQKKQPEINKAKDDKKILPLEPTKRNEALKQQMKYFIELSKKVQNKIQLYKTDSNRNQLFSIENTKKLVKEWNSMFEQEQNSDLGELRDLLKNLDELERYTKSRMIKTNQSTSQKEKVKKNYKQIDNQIDILCYFTSLFEKECTEKKNVFGSFLKKPQFNPKRQEEKFIGSLQKRVKDLQKLSQLYSHRYKIKKNERQLKSNLNKNKSKMSGSKFVFNINQQFSSQDEDPLLNCFDKVIKNRQSRLQIIKNSKVKKVSGSDLAESLAKYEAEQHYVSQRNPLYHFQQLEKAKKEKVENIHEDPLRKYRFKVPESNQLNEKRQKEGEKKMLDKQKRVIAFHNQQSNSSQQKVFQSQEGSDVEIDVPKRTISQIGIIGKGKINQSDIIIKRINSKEKLTQKKENSAPKEQKSKNPNAQSSIGNLFGPPADLATSFNLGIKKDDKKQTPEQTKPKNTNPLSLEKTFESKASFSGDLFGNKTKTVTTAPITPATTSMTTSVTTPITTTSTTVPKTNNLILNNNPKKEETKELKQEINLGELNIKDTKQVNKNPAMPLTAGIKPIEKIGQNLNTQPQPPKIQKKPLSFGSTEKINDNNQKPNLFANRYHRQKPFDQKNKKEELKSEKKTETAGQMNPPAQNQTIVTSQTTNVSPAPIQSNNIFNKKSETNSNPFDFSNKNKQVNPLQNLQQQNAPQSTTQPTAPLNNTPGQSNINFGANFNNQQQQATGTHHPGHASTSFGGPNRFLQAGTASPQQQSTGFNPNQMKFGSGNTQLKSFTNIGQPNPNLLNQNQQFQQNQQQQGMINNQNASWLNNNNNQQKPNWLNQPQQQQQGQTSWLNQSQAGQGQGQQASWLNQSQGQGQGQGQGPNWMNSNQGQQGFNNYNQNMNQMNSNMMGNKLATGPAPPGINPAMMQARK